MTEGTLASVQYRHVDRASKLLGVAFVAAGLEVGGGTTAGIALATVGAVLATATVFLDQQ